MRKSVAIVLITAFTAFPACSDEETPSVSPPINDIKDPPPAYVAPKAVATILSATGPDQLQSVATATDGTVYAAGFTSASTTADKEVVVVKINHNGIDATWAGGDGIAPTGLVFKGGSDEIEIAVQSSGKIVVAAVVANAAQSWDTDIAVVRLNTDGSTDTSFGTNGVSIVDLNTGINGSPATATDRVRGMDVDSNNRIYLHGIQRGVGDYNGSTRTDTDFAVVRLEADGAIDSAFTKYLLDLRGGAPNLKPSNATARSIHVLSDGSVIAGGYATTEGLTTGPQPVLYKLDASGAPITAFANNGSFHDAVLSIQTEVYGFYIRDNQVITGGYGRDSGTANDFVSLKFDATTGARDMQWGLTPNGVVVFDPSGTQATDACRTAVELPNGKTLLIGSTGPANEPAQDAVFAVLDSNGQLDTTYGPGQHLVTFGDVAGGDQFWDARVSGNSSVLVGYRSAGTSQSDVNNDDSYVLLLTLQ